MKIRNLLLSSKIHFIVITLLFVLLPILAIFQYYWLGQLSNAEKIRMQTNLQSSAERFSEEFDKELTTIYNHFNEINLDSKTDNPKLLNETLLSWKSGTKLPEMISNIYTINLLPNQETQFYKLDSINLQLDKVKWPANLHFLKKYFNQEIDDIFFRLISLTHGPILKPTPIILVTQPSEILINPLEEDCTDSWLILIELNKELLKNHFIPFLVKKYFYQDDQLKYNLMIYRQGEGGVEFYKSDEDLKLSDFSETDATANLGTWRTRNMIIASAQYVTDKSEVNITKKIEKEKSLSIKVFTDDSTKNIESSKYLIAKMDRWKLLVKHIDGSLESIVTHARIKNLIISYVILLILGMVIFLALIYARRIQKIGQQQIEFVASVTHELRTPLAVIQSAGENIADGIINTNDHYKKYGSLIRDEGKRLSKMVEQVLDYAGIQSKKQTNNFDKVYLNELINDVVNKFEIKTKIAIDLKCGTLVVKGDKNALKAAISNIIDNSIKYSNTDLQVFIETDKSEDGKFCVIKIIDNGYGIPENEIPQIFNPFYRGKVAADRTISGSGLGLSLVQGIIENHGGTISVKSNINKGSTFNISLPVLITE